MAGKSIFADWYSVLFSARNELVFEGKNKAYGAYVIRKGYARSIVVATGIALGIVVLLVVIPIVFGGKEEIDDPKLIKEVTVDMMTPPPLEENLPPPPPPPPTIKTIAFVPPVAKDEPVEDPPPTQEEIKEENVSTVTQEGAEGPPPPPPANVVIDDNKVYDQTALEEQPDFPNGGYPALMKFLRDNIKYPQIEKENGVQGKAFLTFVIDKDGSVTSVEILKGVPGGASLDKEAVRVVKLMPKWNPGKQNGKAVRVKYVLPVQFKIQ